MFILKIQINCQNPILYKLLSIAKQCKISDQLVKDSYIGEYKSIKV